MPLLKTHRQALILLLFLSALLFSHVLTFDFVNLDDPSHLHHNPYLIPFSELTHLWSAPFLKLYIPFTYTVWSGIAHLSPFFAPTHSLSEPFSPLLFHLANEAFHLFSTWLVFDLLKFFSVAPATAFCSALLFAIHPLQIEPVAWVSCLKDTLSGCLFLVALSSFLGNFLGSFPGSITVNQRFRFFFYLPLLLSLLSKPSTIVWPGVAFTASVLLKKESAQTTFKRLLPAFFLCALFAWMGAQLQPDHLLGFPLPSFSQRIWIALDSLGFYFSKLLMPWHLTVDYGRSPEYVLQNGILLLPLVGLITSLVLFYIARKNRLMAFGIVTFFFTLSPVLGLKPFVFQTTSTVSDRYLYLPLVGLAFFVAGCFHSRYLSKTFFIFPLLFLLGLLTAFQLSHWKDTPTLLNHVLKVNPRSWLALNNLGSWNEKRGQLDTALEFYNRSANIKPQSAVFNNIGAVLFLLKRYPEAVEAYQKGVSFNPLSALDYYGMGISYMAMGEKRKGMQALEKAQALAPELLSERIKLAEQHSLNRQ